MTTEATKTYGMLATSMSLVRRPEALEEDQTLRAEFFLGHQSYEHVHALVTLLPHHDGPWGVVRI